MKKLTGFAAAFLFIGISLSYSQAFPIVNKVELVDSVKFFADEGLVEMTLTTDIKKLQVKGKIDAYQDADVSCTFPDGKVINEKIRLCARGKSRRVTCFLPPIMLDFRNPGAPQLRSLDKLKLVIGCGTSTIDEQLLLKEYLIYKIYNLLEEKSFRARMVKVNYRDSRGKMKPYSQYAFLLEDVDDMAKRNNCKASKKLAYQVEETDPLLMNKVDIFEYMIGNADWSVPANHNIKLIYPKDDESAKVWPVPYDFDNAGLVNAYYAVPSEVIGTEFVTERVYRGYPRKMEDIQKNLDVFRSQKEKIYALVRNFDLLKPQTKNEVMTYLDSFFQLIEDKTRVKGIFIDNARKN